MSAINLSPRFNVLPEGHYVLKITDVEHNEQFGRITVKFETEDGQKHSETYRYINQNGERVDAALRAFSFFARVAMNDEDIESVDTDDLPGKFIECDLEKQSYQKRDGSEGSSVRMMNLESSAGWETAEEDPFADFDL